MIEEYITLDYGSGGEKTSELIRSLFLPVFPHPALQPLSDGAVLSGNNELVFSTDSFVVSPWQFPGGDIGALAVCGTVNDLCMAGGLPRYVSLSLILEEGFPTAHLRTVLASIAGKADEAGVSVVTGDTKVVERGKGDGLYINTAGIGFLHTRLPGMTAACDEDAVLVSGNIGCHGAAVMMARAGLSSLPGASSLRSDCGLLLPLYRALTACCTPRILRDPTRGGVATALCEFVEGTPCSIELDEASIPVDPAVQTACDLLGLDPLYCACEGRMLAVVPDAQAESALSALRRTPGGEGAARIGTVKKDKKSRVTLTTRLGGTRILAKLSGMQLPRIC